MITLAERCENVNLHFSHKLVSSNLKENIFEFKTPNGSKTSEKYDFVFGCDGIWSNVRRQQMREGKVNFSQTYITHSYKELILPAKPSGGYAIAPGYLHIWPRGDYMMIGLANQDGSFTMTLFMPSSVFESIKTDNDVVTFFEDNFPDSIPLFGQEDLLK